MNPRPGRGNSAIAAGCAGFTLAELAIAMVIVGLLLASAFIPLSAQIELRAISDTQRTMDGIRESLIGYAQANGRLPCPATGSIATGAANAGVELLTGNACTSALGVVPWATLGVPETDSWGRRFTYRVSPAYADLYAALTWETKIDTVPVSPGSQSANPPSLPCASVSPAPAAASFALCTVGDIAVFSPTESTRTAAPTAAVAKGIPAIIVSHGKNGYGAFQAFTGIQIPVPGGAHELANVTGTPAATPTSWFASYAYYNRTFSASAGTCSDTVIGASPFCEFDDVVAWISPSTLVARMVGAGKLP
jgi:prepilin-type N-terminal cleavage/methylation domain-containing protein